MRRGNDFVEDLLLSQKCIRKAETPELWAPLRHIRPYEEHTGDSGSEGSWANLSISSEHVFMAELRNRSFFFTADYFNLSNYLLQSNYFWAFLTTWAIYLSIYFHRSITIGWFGSTKYQYRYILFSSRTLLKGFPHRARFKINRYSFEEQLHEIQVVGNLSENGGMLDEPIIPKLANFENAELTEKVKRIFVNLFQLKKVLWS